MNEFTKNLEQHIDNCSQEFASASPATVSQVRYMIEHRMTTDAIIEQVIRFAYYNSLVERSILLADIKAELLKLLRKGETDEDIKSACLRLGWSLADLMPPADTSRQLSFLSSASGRRAPGKAGDQT